MTCPLQQPNGPSLAGPRLCPRSGASGRQQSVWRELAMAVAVLPHGRIVSAGLDERGRVWDPVEAEGGSVEFGRDDREFGCLGLQLLGRGPGERVAGLPAVSQDLCLPECRAQSGRSGGAPL
jgi:hypothetical protein